MTHCLLIGSRKSQIAFKYAYALEKTSPNISVFWIQANTVENFQRGYMAIANTIGFPRLDDPAVSILQLVKSYLEAPESRKWLMIVDNADDSEVFWSQGVESQHIQSAAKVYLESVIPQSIPGSILITTRNKQVGLRLVREGALIPVPAMTTEEAEQLFAARFKGIIPDPGRVKDLVEEMESDTCFSHCATCRHLTCFTTIPPRECATNIRGRSFSCHGIHSGQNVTLATTYKNENLLLS